MIDVTKLSIPQAQKDLREKKYSAVELLDACMENIKNKDGEMEAFLEIFDDSKQMAEKADEMLAKGEEKSLTGIPISLKDNILYKGHIAGAASAILENHKAVYDSNAVLLLKEEGAVIVGRCNMDDAAMGSSGETSPYKKTKNPYDISKVPGGSSCGSAVSVATGMCLASLGSDTAGSVRQPAGFCGVVGFKPTYGNVSRSGLISMANSFDVIGPITKTPKGAKIVFDAIKGYDSMDSTSNKIENRIQEKKEVKKIGVPRSFIEMEGLDPETKSSFEESLKKLESLGYELVDVDLDIFKYSVPAYYIITPAEVSSNLARYDGIRYGLSVPGKNVDESYMKTREAGFGKEVKRRILVGTYVLSHGYYDAYYNKAIKIKQKITSEIEKVFQDVDLIVTPTSPTPAFEFGAKKNPVEMYMADIFTVPANMTGTPAISIPNGFTEGGLPLDLHLTAPHHHENLLFEVAEKFTN
jgi:aspartyl-tRNA(Asn)/glutamyl-tRNA(Gln) amidotransferase subunit A